MPTRSKRSKIPPHFINPHAEAPLPNACQTASNSAGLGRTLWFDSGGRFVSIKLFWSWFSKEGFILCKTTHSINETRESAGEVWDHMRKRVECEYLRVLNGVEEIYCGAALHQRSSLDDEEETEQQRSSLIDLTDQWSTFVPDTTDPTDAIIRKWFADTTLYGFCTTLEDTASDW